MTTVYAGTVVPDAGGGLSGRLARAFGSDAELAWRERWAAAGEGLGQTAERHRARYDRLARAVRYLAGRAWPVAAG